MPVNPLLRPYMASDRDRVVAHLSETWFATYGADFARATLADLSQAAGLPEGLIGPGGQMIVAETETGIVGTVAFRSNDQVSYLSGMYVRPGWQRRGLGTRPRLAACEALPRDRTVILYALQQSTGAIAFYAQRGFQRFEATTMAISGTEMPVIGMRLPR